MERAFIMLLYNVCSISLLILEQYNIFTSTCTMAKSEKYMYTLQQNDEELTFSHVTNSVNNDVITGVCCPTVSKVNVS